MATCANHPIRMATARCKCCNKPLCNECRHVTDAGIFCSPECESRTRQFTERASGGTVTYRKRFFTKRTVRGLLILLIVLIGAAAFLHFTLGVSSWSDLKAVFAQWWEARYLLLP
ncbi:hypothetical protein JXA47_10650 [Candidatus Sumerlaeota bacterium]|nr:hypothetical protein [Candidatus Sumerlaeota bacterium]